MLIGNDAVCLSWKKEDATNILLQAMMDETIRLRKCRKNRERKTIMQFLLSAHAAIQGNGYGTDNQGQCLDCTQEMRQ